MPSGSPSMVKTGDVPVRSVPPPASPPLLPPHPPPPPPLPPPSPSSVSRHDQIATIKRNLNFLQRTTQQPLPIIPSTNTPSSTPNPSATQPPATYILEPSWTTFKNHFQVPYPPPGYSKNTAFTCPPPPLGHVDVKSTDHLPPPICRPPADTTESSACFEFALEAEKMVSELCSSSKDTEKALAVDTNRYEVSDGRRHPEAWSIKHREIRTHDMDDYHQPVRTTPNSHVKLETGIQLSCIYEDDLSLRDFIVKGCIEVGNALKGHERHSHLHDLIGFCRMVRESAENPAAHEFHHDEARSQILAFFRLASSWLSIYPLIQHAGVQKDEFRIQLYRYFNDWQISTRRMMELIVKNVPSLKERVDSDINSDSLAFGDQVHKRQPFFPMHYDPRNAMDNLRRQRSVPNVQNPHRQWRQRRFSDNHNEENFNWHRNNVQNPKDGNNRNKWTIVSPDMYHHKPPPFRKPDIQSYQDKTENQSRYRPKMHSADCIPGRSTVFNDHDKMPKWTKYHVYSPLEQDAAYKRQDDSNQNDDLVQHNHDMVLLSQIEPRLIQKHSDQQPVDLDALFQGYRAASENPERNRHVYKVPPNQMRNGCNDKVNPHSRGRRWYNNYNFCPPPWVANANYDQDDPQDGVYMKPGSYDVPKRDQKPVARQLTTPPPPPAPASTVITSPAPRYKPAQTDEVTWQAALASAETFCKSLRSNENQGPQSDAQQQWMIQSNCSSESDVVEVQRHRGEAAGAADVAVVEAADATASRTAVKKSQSSKERKPLSPSPSPPPPPSPPPSKQPSSSSPPSQSARPRNLSPTASQKLKRFLETVWAVNEASHIKFSPDQEDDGVDSKKVLEDTFQRLLDDGWAAGGPTAAAAAAAAVSCRQTKQ